MATIQFLRPDLESNSLGAPVPFNPPPLQGDTDGLYIFISTKKFLIVLLQLCQILENWCWPLLQNIYYCHQLLEHYGSQVQHRSVIYLIIYFSIRWVGEKYDGIRFCWHSKDHTVYLCYRQVKKGRKKEKYFCNNLDTHAMVSFCLWQQVWKEILVIFLLMVNFGMFTQWDNPLPFYSPSTLSFSTFSFPATFIFHFPFCFLFCFPFHLTIIAGVDGGCFQKPLEYFILNS